MTRAGRFVLAGSLLAGSLLPIADWIPGGHGLAHAGLTLESWFYGSLIAVGLGWILGTSWHRSDGFGGRGVRWATRWEAWATSPAAPWIIAILAGVLYLITASVVFGRLPIIIDDVVQVWQARSYAAGHLKLPSLGPVGYFGLPHVIDDGTWRYGQFPFGGPALLALGAPWHAEWVVDPVLAAIGVFAFARWLPRVEPRPRVRLIALVLFAFAPFAMFISGTEMNHVGTGTCTLVALCALAAGFERGAGWSFAVGGFALGIAGTIRPVDALAFVLPAGLWLTWRAVRGNGRWRDLMLYCAGGAIPAAALLWVDLQTTGSPFLLGYTVLWGKGHSLGFHAAPWGDPH
ncbi:MAG TPA: hypothetical protein VFI13_12250, partial [Gemmatimonadales bacterium]|nr:hypothetical protein [Gemmatimonadales bacterium]